MIKTLLAKWKPAPERLSAVESERIEGYINKYQGILRQAGEMSLDRLEADHRSMTSSLHRGADSPEVIIPAFIYSNLRLPECIDRVQRVIVGPSQDSFSRPGLEDISAWEPAPARARKRKAFFDGKETLAVVISSVSDIDDLIPALCAYQIEWNKMHLRLGRSSLGRDLAGGRLRAPADKESVRSALNLSSADMELLAETWAGRFAEKTAALAQGPKNFQVRLLPLGPGDHEREVRKWWRTLLEGLEGFDLENRPLYLVSSNNHCLANIISGFAFRHRQALLDQALENDREGLRRTWQRLKGEDEEARLNFYYYVQRGFLESRPEYQAVQSRMEGETGLQRVHLPGSETQVIDLSRLCPDRLDPRLSRAGLEVLKQSRALILNLEHPLGFSAYQVMGRVCGRVKGLRGVYLMGKSAAMIGRLGDIIIPSVIRDVHTRNLYRISNCFSIRQVVRYLRQAAVFGDQQSVTVRGTFLHNWESMKHLQRRDFTGIEMEAGPFLSALYEYFHSAPAPRQEVVSIKSQGPFDIGILHYTSDTPYNLRASLLSRRMGYTGLEAAYGCALSILGSVLQREMYWLRQSVSRA